MNWDLFAAFIRKLVEVKKIKTLTDPYTYFLHSTSILKTCCNQHLDYILFANIAYTPLDFE